MHDLEGADDAARMSLVGHLSLLPWGQGVQDRQRSYLHMPIVTLGNPAYLHMPSVTLGSPAHLHMPSVTLGSPARHVCLCGQALTILFRCRWLPVFMASHFPAQNVTTASIL